MAETIPCATCGLDDTTVALTKWGHTLVTCKQCDLTYVNPRSFAVELDEYFRGPYLETIESGGELRHEIADLYHTILGSLRHQINPGRLLDVGCAMGHFLVAAREEGWEVQGVECSAYAVAYGRSRWNLAMRAACDLRDAHLVPNHFDACTMIEVIEHLPHPAVTLSEIYRVLKPGGMVYITTPNFSSYKSLLLRDHWDVIIPSGHLYYFTANSLRQMLLATHFECIWDLTDPASFDQECQAVGSMMAMSADDLGLLKAQLVAQDATAVSNGRAEGLRMVAFKPVQPGQYPVASAKNLEPLLPLEGRLVTIGGASAESQKVYLISGGRKHWVVNGQWLTDHGLSLASTIQVPVHVLERYFPGQPLT